MYTCEQSLVGRVAVGVDEHCIVGELPAGRVHAGSRGGVVIQLQVALVLMHVANVAPHHVPDAHCTGQTTIGINWNINYAHAGEKFIQKLLADQNAEFNTEGIKVGPELKDVLGNLVVVRALAHQGDQASRVQAERRILLLPTRGIGGVADD